MDIQQHTPLHEHFRYDDLDSLRNLRSALLFDDAPPLQALLDISIMSTALGLINPQGSVIFKWFYKRAKPQTKLNFCRSNMDIMFKRGLHVLFFSKMVDHMVHGVDESPDANSAGGWNKEEFNLFLHILHSFGYTYTERIDSASFDENVVELVRNIVAKR